jgi:hypothetical protein
MSYGSSGVSGSSGAAPRRSRGIRSSFNKDSELVELGASVDDPLLIVVNDRYSEYVNAQFRFVMKPSGNYTAHFADPDLSVQLALISFLSSRLISLLRL